ncbi:methyl-accepting chemotaxis protein [Brevibacillus agri]|nr:methyl-accepting chemotaxis protein [Brevibacillus agri]MED1824249.1 methyl-accepting chemotaxis protein [Brevibacillus agri]
MAQRAKQVAEGDLTGAKIEVKNRDEIGQLAEAFTLMTDHLRQLISRVHLGSEQVASTSEQLTASAEQTSRATEQIAVTMQEMAVGTEEQSKTVEALPLSRTRCEFSRSSLQNLRSRSRS